MTKADDNGEIATEGSKDAPESPSLGKLRKGNPSTIHALGDLHGWAPGLINYLLSHELAEISIDGISLGRSHSKDSNAENNIDAMEKFFGRDQAEPVAGLRGMPYFDDAINGEGHGRIRARWIAGDDTCFVQIGDIFDRADHSELAAEVLRQLIIDAPNRVFVLVGNHEQFMLENSEKNWYLNEARNALTDPAEFPQVAAGKHTRFFPNISCPLPEDRAHQVIFPCYRLSTYTLFLTQAAAQQKSGFVERGMSKELIEGLLSEGWGPYKTAKTEMDSTSAVGTAIPGALTAIVIGENLFHHAEPGPHLNELPEMVKWTNWFGWVDYVAGGSIQESPHSPFLWTRDACNGAQNGTPRVGSQIDQLRSSWPGLYRIIHGHSPTVGVDEFTRDMGRGIDATSCSYLGEDQSATASRDCASSIRVYNIDEALSPVYYQGSKEKDSTTRIPLGLRVSDAANIRLPVILHSDTDHLLSLEKDRDVKTDTRELWSWKPSQFKLIGKDQWQTKTSGPTIVEFDDSIWIVEASKAGVDILTRRLAGYDLIPNVLRSILKESMPDLLWRDPDPPPTSLKYMNSNELGKVFGHLFNDQGSWRTVEELGLVAVGFKLLDENTAQIITVCSSSEVPRTTFSSYSDLRHNLGITTKGKSKSLKLNPNSVVEYSLNLPAHPLCIGIESKKTLHYWMSESKKKPHTRPHSISYWPATKKGKMKLIPKSEWEFPIKPPVVPEPIASEKAPHTKKPDKKQIPPKANVLGFGFSRWKAAPKGDLRDTQRSMKNKSTPHVDLRDTQRSMKKKSTPHVDIRHSQSKSPKDSKSAVNPAQFTRITSNPEFELNVTINNEEFENILKKCGIKGRSLNAPPATITIQQMTKGTSTTFIIGGQNEVFRWGLDDAGDPNAVRNKHGMNGDHLKRLFEHPEFKKIIRELQDKTDWK